MEQLNIFEVMKPKYKITKPIRLIELFAGLGSQAKALENLNIPFEHYRICEFDKYAVASYNAIHNTSFNTSDITQINSKDLRIVDTDKYEYIMTYSFPCTDLSLAGKQKGMAKGSSTRSGLLWEVERLLDECEELPQILLMENVPQVIGENNFQDFREWQLKLENLGYSNYFELLNAKDYGIPQNRNRCFMVSILGDYYYEFPSKIKLKLRLKDMLEDEVDEKYYLSEKTIQQIANWKSFQNPLENVLGKDSISPTITTRVAETDAGGISASMHLYSKELDKSEDLKEPLMNYAPKSRDFKENGWKNVAQTLLARDYKDPKIVLIPGVANNECIQLDLQQNVKVRKYEVNIEKLKSVLREHKNISNKEIAEKLNQPITLVEHWFRQDNSFAIPNADIWFRLKELLEITTNEFDNSITEFEIKPNEYEISNRAYLDKGISPTITSGLQPNVAVAQRGRENGQELEISDREYANAITTVQKDSMVTNNLRIRKLTPRECFRLMGFSDEDFDKASKVNSNSQLYKQAGNSIVVNVLMEIFRQLF